MPGRINLLPKSERVRTTTNVPALALLVASIVVIFILALSYYLLNGQRAALKDDLTVLQGQTNRLQAEVAGLEEYRQSASEAARVEKIVNQVYAGRTLVSEVLSDLSRALPPDAWLTSLSLTAADPSSGLDESTAGSVSMQGNTYGFPSVGALMQQLKLVPASRNVTLGSAGSPIGSVDPTKDVRGLRSTAVVVNTQPAGTQLPVSRVEVETE